MFCLVDYIILDHVQLRGAYGKRAVTFLPRKRRRANAMVNPFRRSLFDVPNHVRQAVCRPESDQQMHMIGRATYRLGHASGRANSSTQISVKPVTPSRINKRATFFRAEYDMIVKTEMG